jgi:glycosyltransferase involved in cell wall biosynthesis
MNDPMRVCLIATELRGFGAHGGFGAVTWEIASGLAARGTEVYIAMPRKEGQKPVETVGPVTVLSYPSPLYTGLRKVVAFAGVYRMIDADIFHSQEPSLGTALARMGAPERKHIVTFRAPRDLEDWKLQWGSPPRSRWGCWKFWRRYQRETAEAARRADARFCPAKFILEKTTRIYKLKEPPGFLPNPVRMPERKSPKAANPTVCYLGRWDPIKRPELFLALAEKFPEVTFVAAGDCRLTDRPRDEQLRRKCRELKNVQAPGWLNEKDREAMLDNAWILVNTSEREGLPVSYLEAAARECAILSYRDADQFASNFGFWAKTGELEGFVTGLRFLLENGRWMGLGRKAHDYVKNTYEYSNAIDRHLKIYQQGLTQSSPP